MSIATTAAFRFGTGLAPKLSLPQTAGAITAALAGPDNARERFPVASLAEHWPLVTEIAAARQARYADEDGAEERFETASKAIIAAQFDGLRARLARAVLTEDGFRERLTWFWSDHFTVRAKSARFRAGPAIYADDAIRPHVAGRFGDMLRAAATHPVMLSYLDQNRSLGPASPAGKRRAQGLNENLAREILELHTLGVDAGFGQSDVTEFAELLTGLTFDIKRGFEFRPNWAEPGAEQVFGKVYGGSGKGSLADIFTALEDIARAPATAAHLAHKLAVHFVSDDPDPDLVATMVAAYRETGGHLARVYEAMLAHPAAWAPPAAKARQPFEFIAASLRALGTTEARLAALDKRDMRRQVLRPLQRMGQPFEKPPGPNGWPERPEAWITPPALAERISWAMNVEALHGGPMPAPGAFVDMALGDRANEGLRTAVRRAESKRAGVGLVLASPAFNRR